MKYSINETEGSWHKSHSSRKATNKCYHTTSFLVLTICLFPPSPVCNLFVIPVLPVGPFLQFLQFACFPLSPVWPGKDLFAANWDRGGPVGKVSCRVWIPFRLPGISFGFFFVWGERFGLFGGNSSWRHFAKSTWCQRGKHPLTLPLRLPQV